jgi:hypothetical protein
MPEHKQRKHYGNADADPRKDLHSFIVEQVFGFSTTKENTAILNMGAQTQYAPAMNPLCPFSLLNPQPPHYFCVLTRTARPSQRRHQHGAP